MPNSVAVINPDFEGPELVFMSFDYGDITPQTIPAKILTLTEITLAFVTVIFLLSDFISVKESIRRPPTKP